MKSMFNDVFKTKISQAESENMYKFGYVKDQVLRAQLQLSECINTLDELRDIIDQNLLENLMISRNRMTKGFRTLNTVLEKINKRLK